MSKKRVKAGQSSDIVLDITAAAQDLGATRATRALPGRKTMLEKRAQESSGKGFYCTLPLELHRRVRDFKFACHDAGEELTLSQIVAEALVEYLDRR